MATATVTIDDEDRENLAMLAHPKTNMHSPTTVPNFLKVGCDRLEPKKSIHGAGYCSNSRASRIVVIGGARNQELVVMVLVALSHLSELIARETMLLDERKSRDPGGHACFMGGQRSNVLALQKEAVLMVPFRSLIRLVNGIKASPLGIITGRS